MTAGTNPDVPVGRRIREARQYAGITQAELADSAAVSRRTIAAIEAGEQTADAFLLAVIADTCATTSRHLLGLATTRFEHLSGRARTLCELDAVCNDIGVPRTRPTPDNPSLGDLETIEQRFVSAYEAGWVGIGFLVEAFNEPVDTLTERLAADGITPPAAAVSNLSAV